MKKLIFVFVLLFSLISCVSADSLIYSYTNINSDGYIPLRGSGFPSTGTVGDGAGLILTMGNNSYELTTITFWLYRTGTINGFMYVRVYSVFGVSSLLASSNYVNTQSISTSIYGSWNFSFSGSNKIILSANLTYIFVMIAYNGTWSSSNYIRMGNDISSPTFNFGSVIWHSLGTFNVYSLNYEYDSIFWLYGNLITPETEFIFNGNATINDVLINQTFYSNSSILQIGNYTAILEDSEESNSEYFILGGTITFLVTSLIFFTFIERKKR